MIISLTPMSVCASVRRIITHVPIDQFQMKTPLCLIKIDWAVCRVSPKCLFCLLLYVFNFSYLLYCRLKKCDIETSRTVLIARLPGQHQQTSSGACNSAASARARRHCLRHCVAACVTIISELSITPHLWYIYGYLSANEWFECRHKSFVRYLLYDKI